MLTGLSRSTRHLGKEFVQIWNISILQNKRRPNTFLAWQIIHREKDHLKHFFLLSYFLGKLVWGVEQEKLQA